MLVLQQMGLTKLKCSPFVRRRVEYKLSVDEKEIFETYATARFYRDSIANSRSPFSPYPAILTKLDFIVDKLFVLKDKAERQREQRRELSESEQLEFNSLSKAAERYRELLKYPTLYNKERTERMLTITLAKLEKIVAARMELRK